MSIQHENLDAYVDALTGVIERASALRERAQRAANIAREFPGISKTAIEEIRDNLIDSLPIAAIDAELVAMNAIKDAAVGIERDKDGTIRDKVVPQIEVPIKGGK